MAAVRSLRVSVKSDCSESDSDRDAREFEPMEVEEGELEAEDIPVNRSLNEVLPDAIERTEKSTESFHFCAQANPAQIVVLDRDTMKKAIPNLRLEALHVAGVDDMSTQDVFGYFKEYPPAHIEWIDDASCNVVWLDDVTSTRALINISHVPDPEVVTKETGDTKELGDPTQESKARGQSDDDDDDDDGEVEEEQKEPVKENREESEGKASEGETEEKTEPETTQVDLLSQAEIESLLRNDLRPATKPFKGNRLFLRLATHDDKKEMGAARKSRYYMKYGNPNYGGMRGILSNSWKRRYHTRRIVSKKPLIGDSMGDTPPYKHSHSADLINLPEEPIEEEEDEEEDMDSDDRVVEYKEKGERGRVRVGGPVVALWSRLGRPSSPSVLSDSDKMDYDLELKMISTPSPKKSMKMTMYADEVETNLRTIRHSAVRRDSGSGGSGIRNRIGGGAVGETKSSAVEKVIDVRQLLEEKRRGLSQHKHRHPVASIGSRLWNRLGPSYKGEVPERKPPSHRAGSGSTSSRLGGRGEEDVEKENDSALQKVWGALIKQKEQQTHKMKRSRLDNLPSLQIEISRESSNGSDSDS
ncbi:nuclear cap-binding protein subunit 3-like isoform X3 [Oncorhynchus clarkii lewisi]|uniref:nuclear cap-binding protein subunit 3-like isoform X3 n=1 Tax=Oncorhynchus clarkii lewisi TaxID=490388 RepID=UPI0039B99625